MSDQFNRAESKANRDEGISHAQSGAPVSWLVRAEQAGVRCAKDRVEFTVDDIWTYMESGDEPRELRAMGAVLRNLQRDGLIRATGRMDRTARVRGHCGWRTIWTAA